MWDVGCEMWVCVLLVILDVRRETVRPYTSYHLVPVPRDRVTA